MKLPETIQPWYLVIDPSLDGRGDGSFGACLTAAVAPLAEDPGLRGTIRLGTFALAEEVAAPDPLTEITRTHQWAVRLQGDPASTADVLRRVVEQVGKDRDQLEADSYQVDTAVLVLLLRSQPADLSEALTAFSQLAQARPRLVIVTPDANGGKTEPHPVVTEWLTLPSPDHRSLRQVLHTVVRMMGASARHGIFSTVRAPAAL